MSERWIRPVCAVLVFVTWVVDVVTPQSLVVAILLNAPIALSSLALDVRLTQLLVISAIAADVTAGFADIAVSHEHWNTIAVLNRIIAAFSFLLVGALSNAARRSAIRAGELAARQDRAMRERSVRRAIEAVRASVNPQLVERAIVREAIAPLGASRAFLYVFGANADEPASYESDGRDVTLQAARPPAAILSLLHRVAEGHDCAEIRRDDAMGRLVLDTLGAACAYAAPLVEYRTVYGILVLTREAAAFESQFEEGLRYYADHAAIALAQAKLFVALAEGNDALRERGDVIRDIVYALSHDLRTPLSAARMTMHQALDGAFGELPPAYRDILERSIASNEELERLAETLLLVSRYESGDRSVRHEPVALAPLCAEVVAGLEPLWRGKRVAVSLDAADGVETFGDARELRRALVNLVANAVTWTPANGSVRVRLRLDGNRAYVAVEDDGYGVPEAERAQLFQRVRQSHARRGAGSGLGLYLVRRIAEAHGGTVSYAPRATAGSTFELALPLAPIAVRA